MSKGDKKPKQTPFHNPMDGQEKLEANIWLRIRMLEGQSEPAVKKAQLPFHCPEGFFANQESDILNKVAKSQHSKAKSAFWKTALPIAASLLLGVCVSWWALGYQPLTTETTSIAHLNDTEVTHYLTSQLTDDEVIEVLDYTNPTFHLMELDKDLQFLESENAGSEFQIDQFSPISSSYFD